MSDGYRSSAASPRPSARSAQRGDLEYTERIDQREVVAGADVRVGPRSTCPDPPHGRGGD